MLPISTLIGKTILRLLKRTGRRGSALPGLIIEKIDNSYLSRTLSQLSQGVIIVTGTNGKTTTTKVIKELLESQGLKVLSNETGSNFVRGIIATIIEKASWSGKLSYDIAVIEQDEAYAVRFVDRFQPRGLVALNVMRDQMDRFGEIDKTGELITKAAASATEWLVLNSNDKRIAGISKGLPGKKVIWFGHAESLKHNFVGDDEHHSGSDIRFFEAAKPDVCLTAVGNDSLSVTMGKEITFTPQLEGTHNALNITAALAAVKAILPETDEAVLADALESIKPAFGRGEQITLKNGSKLHLQLVKNPAGFTHSLRLLDNKQFDLIAIAINDDFADGRDVSWLWDVDFEPVAAHGAPVLCGGVRAYDMAVRLKYQEVQPDLVDTSFESFLLRILDDSHPTADMVLFCTYTAMLEFRGLIKKHALLMNKEGL